MFSHLLFGTFSLSMAMKWRHLWSRVTNTPFFYFLYLVLFQSPFFFSWFLLFTVLERHTEMKRHWWGFLWDKMLESFSWFPFSCLMGMLLAGNLSTRVRSSWVLFFPLFSFLQGWFCVYEMSSKLSSAPHVAHPLPPSPSFPPSSVKEKRKKKSGDLFLVCRLAGWVGWIGWLGFFDPFSLVLKNFFFWSFLFYIWFGLFHTSLWYSFMAKRVSFFSSLFFYPLLQR